MQLSTTHKIDAETIPVHSVTIFQSDCAEVVRKFAISLKVGSPSNSAYATNLE